MNKLHSFSFSKLTFKIEFGFSHTLVFYSFLHTCHGADKGVRNVSPLESCS